jgi:para-aminobenzoate synthetase component 1
LSTPFKPSISLEPAEFDRLAQLAAERYDADLFLTNSPDTDRVCIIGLWPDRELSIDPDTTRERLKEFAFGDKAPTYGFLSYPYGMVLKGLRTDQRSDFPLGHLKKYGATIAYDRHMQSLTTELYEEACATELKALISSIGSGGHPPEPGGNPGEITVSLGRGEYIAGVEGALDYIHQGYTYQLNLTTRFELDWPGLNEPALFMHLWRRFPSAFYTRFVSGRFRILSTSPERFLQVRNGVVVSEPIKGTLRIDRREPAPVQRLTESVKEDAELSMIVDLMRNDISYNCEYGSVAVEKHKATFVVDDLLQMYSRITGRLRQDRTCIDLLLDAFPCGSVTGCPKRKTMEIIDQLEPHSRDIYCGTIVVIRGPRDMESSVAIRTGYYDSVTTRFRFYAGSGIVALSDPAAEYAETLAKAAKFRAVAGSKTE